MEREKKEVLDGIRMMLEKSQKQKDRRTGRHACTNRQMLIR